MNEIIIKNYKEIPINEREAFRYMGVRNPDEPMKKLFAECVTESENVFTFNVCYGEFPLSCNEDEIDLGFGKTKSKALSKNLASCERIVLFAATVGHGIDRLIKKESLLSPAKSVCLQALGSERVESLCDFFNNELKEQYLQKGFHLKPRFSPGYGDLPLELQKAIIPALDCTKHLGISLGNNLMMTPSKSVTAIIGIYK
ncbi:MAG: vitamin B12 dependent-methionine synthase activation domain-containing protein [Clostridia bacterium]|nr:vitamin B12 dependent-methionine synthase activation domain-containing protein [Clostridia bacterium]